MSIVLCNNVINALGMQVYSSVSAPGVGFPVML